MLKKLRPKGAAKSELKRDIKNAKRSLAHVEENIHRMMKKVNKFARARKRRKTFLIILLLLVIVGAGANAAEIRRKQGGAILTYRMRDIAAVYAALEDKTVRASVDIEDLSPLAELLRDE